MIIKVKFSNRKLIAYGNFVLSKTDDLSFNKLLIECNTEVDHSLWSTMHFNARHMAIPGY